jgi:hypothetical protein
MISITKNCWFILFKELIAIYCDNHPKSEILSAARIQNVKAVGHRMVMQF